MKVPPSIVVFVVFGLLHAPTHAEIQLRIVIDDSESPQPSFHEAIRSHLHAAAAEWSKFLAGDALIDLRVVVKPGGEGASANGGSVTTGEIGRQGKARVFQDGVAYELMTGRDPNGGEVDAVITLYDDYLRNRLWFDPDPYSRAAPKPEERKDAVTTMMHELGHCLGWNGWQLPDLNPIRHFRSTFDTFLVRSGEHIYFRGYQSKRIHGGIVPINSESAHLGGPFPEPGWQYETSVMFGGYTPDRRAITPLDLSVIADTGLRLTPAGRQMLAAAGGVHETPWEKQRLTFDWFGYFDTLHWPSIRHGVVGLATVQNQNGGLTTIRLANSKADRVKVSRARWPWVVVESRHRDLPRRGLMKMTVEYNGVRYFQAKGKRRVRDRRAF